jgi:hypothetical protein
MTLSDIALQRLKNQQLAGTGFKTPKDMVWYMGAVQAQDYTMAKWAIGARLPTASDKSIELAINRGDIIRTHVLRPTWHFVSAKDIRWMLALTGPRILSATASGFRLLGLEERLARRSNMLIAKALAGNKQLTRAELMAVLAGAGIKANSLQAIHLMLHAELDAVVCNGAMRGKQFTYTLLDEKVPQTNAFQKEEALAKLALRYFTSHGPATLPDFAWWSGLTMADARAGLEANKKRLLSEKVNGQEYWFSGNAENIAGSKETVLFLPAYDEFMISYKDRAVSVDAAFTKKIITRNGIFNPVIVVNGKVTGTWKRSIKKGIIEITPLFFKRSDRLKKNVIDSATAYFGTFSGAKTKIIYNKK